MRKQFFRDFSAEKDACGNLYLLDLSEVQCFRALMSFYYDLYCHTETSCLCHRCFSCRQFQLQQNRPAQSYSNVSDCSAVCRCAGSLPSVVLQLTVKLTIKVNMYLWTEALSACSCGIKCSEMFKDLNVCVCQMSLVDLGKRLLEAARKGQDDEVRNLMANGAPFTTDWVRLAAVWSDSSVRVTAGSTWFNVMYSLTWENPRCCSPSQSVQSKHTHITTVPSEPQQPVFMLVMVFHLTCRYSFWNKTETMRMIFMFVSSHTQTEIHQKTK